jgi:biotin carboxyl carrier protein
MSNKIEAPVPGVILDIKVNVGDVVKTNQVLCILEALKMENDVVTPWAGTVTGIHVKVGEEVDTEALMFTID